MFYSFEHLQPKLAENELRAKKSIHLEISSCKQPA